VVTIKNARLDPQPFWGYENIGAFFILIVSLSLILRLLAVFTSSRGPRSSTQGSGLQSAVVVFLGTGLYSVLRFRHRQPVLSRLG
jgi:hypothetical protein